jgi:hypothetical protein
MSRRFLLQAGAVPLLLLLLSAQPATLATAQTTGVTMTVTPYLGGYVKYGEWLPLRVSLSNHGDDLEAEVQTRIAGNNGDAVYAAPAPLPAGARKEIDLYVLPPTYGQSLVVQLIQGEQVLAEATVNLSTHLQSDYLFAAVASAPDAFALLNGLALPRRFQAIVIPLSLDDLPERAEALRSLDCLVLTDVDTTSLTPAQGEALRAWVELGGRLFIGGGAGAQRTLLGLPRPLNPVELGGTVELSTLDSLADFAGEPIRVPGPFLATLPVAHEGQAVITQAGQPLLVQRALGEGWIAYSALDPAASPFNAWTGTLPFWRKLLEPGSALSPNVPNDIPLRMLESEQMNYALSNLPALDLPSIRWLALLLGVYILLVGPVNYLLLRRLRRLDWAWVTIPALTMAFSIGGFGIGYGLRGGDLILNQISIIPLAPGSERTLARSYVGLFSPTRGDYDMRIDSGALVSPLYLSYRPDPWTSTGDTTGGLDVLQGDPVILRGLGINQWAMQTFQAETWLDTTDLELDADLSIEADHVRGMLHNDLARPLREITLISGHRFAQLGDLDAGQTKEINEVLQGETWGPPFPWALFEQHFQGPESPPREVLLRQSILEAYFHTNWGTPAPQPAGLTLLAWTDVSPLDVELAGARASRIQTTLLVVQLPLPVVDGRVSLPLGSFVGRLVESEGEAGECGTSGQAYIGNGRVVLEYKLPAALRALEPERLTVRLGTDGGFPTELPTLSFYDWTAGDWAEITDIELNQSYSVDRPARFVSPVGGTIRLQAQRDNWGDGWCFQFDLGLEGELQTGEETP